MASKRKSTIPAPAMRHCTRQLAPSHPATMSYTGIPANTSPSVPAEQRASYAAIIDEILANADLETISAKRIRNGLQERVDYDLTPQKVDLID
jgi:hypothetical protein